MDWLVNLFTQQDSVAHIALLFSLVIAIGVLLGKIKVGGISLGVTFVLFAGILAGHIGFTAPTNILTFMQDFGLILFVFMIGLQVGPGFFESFKKGGVTLNILSTATILLDVAVMFACYFLFFDTSNPVNLPMMVGTLYGAVTNTPGLGAANESLNSVFPAGRYLLSHRDMPVPIPSAYWVSLALPSPSATSARSSWRKKTSSCKISKLPTRTSSPIRCTSR